MAQSSFSYTSLLWRRTLYSLLLTIVWWNLSIRLFVFIRYIGSVDRGINRLIRNISWLFDNPIFATVVISAFAIFIFTLKRTVARALNPHISIIFKFILYSFIYFLSFSTVFLLAFGYENGFNHIEGFDKIEGLISSFYKNSNTLFFFLIGLLTSISLDVAKSVKESLGPKAFWALLFGSYRRPKERKRIFLFLDLVSSTTIAEQIGHKKYSRFVQACFRGMGRSLLATGGSVYQFVGDEVVITWPASKRNRRRAVLFFCLFSEKIEAESNDFENRYGAIPRFTGALNSGKVMVSEVGDIKRELAYHGDVLNTAARVQKMCKKYNQPLLATEDFISKYDPEKQNVGCSVKRMGNAALAGKSQSTTIYAINKIIEKDKKDNG